MRDLQILRGRLLDETDRLKAKVRLIAERNEGSGLFYRGREAKIVGQNPQLFPTCLMIFNNLKP